MSSLEKPSRRALVAWGLASTGLPFVSQALVPMAGGQMKPNEIGARIGQTVPVPPGLQIFYRHEWFGAPWAALEGFIAGLFAAMAMATLMSIYFHAHHKKGVEFYQLLLGGSDRKLG